MSRAPGLPFADAAAGLRPDPRLTVSAWADKHRYLSSIDSGEPGQWRTARTPYLREIMDRLSPSDPCDEVVIMAGAQTGKTSTGINWIGYIVAHSPAPVLAVQPTVELAKRWSKQRLAPMIQTTPALRELVRDNRSRDSGNTLLAKEFPGGVLIVTGANSAAGLRSMPVRFLFLDEVDAYPLDVDGEGDPVALARARQATFARSKLLMTSTPTRKGESRIETEYLASDARRFYVPCPACRHMQALEWQNVRWTNADPATAGYQCEGCGTLAADWQKTAMLDGGEWRPTRETDGRVRGYALSSLYSPHGWRASSWPSLAREFVAARGDPVALKVFVNTRLAQTWDDAHGEGVDDDALMARRETWGQAKDPNEWPAPVQVAVVTAGVDVQDDRIEIEIVGWGLGEESWSLAHRVIQGDPSAPAIWTALDALLLEPVRRAGAGRDALPIDAACIDTGGHHTQAAYAFVRGKPRRRRVWAIKGRDGKLPIWPRKPSRANIGRVPLYAIGVDTAKESIYARLRRGDPGPGYLHFPLGRPAEYFRQLTAEKRQTVYKRGFKRVLWVKASGVRNEALDLRVYAYAALHGWYASGGRIDRALDRLRRGAESGRAVVAPGGAPPADHPPDPRRRPRSSWWGRRE